MPLYKHFPQPSDRMGELWVLLPVEGITVLEFGPAGTTHFSMEGFFQLGAEMKSELYTTHIDESDIALGSTVRLEKAIEEIVEIHAPSILFVFDSSISAIIGTDISAIIDEMQIRFPQTKMVGMKGGGLNDIWTVGIEKAMYKLVENLALIKKNDTMKVNIIGSCIDDYNYKADALEIARMIKGAFNYDVGCTFPSDCSAQDISLMPNASLNIVIRREGIKSAKLLEERFNTPWIYMRPYGVNDSKVFIDEISKIINEKYNENFVKHELAESEKHLKNLKLALKRKDLPVIINGHMDTVEGIVRFIKGELGIKSVNASCNAQCMENKDIKFMSNTDLESELINFGEGLIMADAVSLEISKISEAKAQISNPNLGNVLIYPYCPWMGFRGALHLLEVFTNAIRKLD